MIRRLRRWWNRPRGYWRYHVIVTSGNLIVLEGDAEQLWHMQQINGPPTVWVRGPFRITLHREWVAL